MKYLLPVESWQRVDVFDALVTARSYRKSLDYRLDRSIFKNGNGRVMSTHFDPQLLRLFIEKYETFVETHRSLKD